MSHIGISITKSCPFRDSVQEFSNVYYYENVGGALPSPSEADALIDELVAFEKTIHSSSVTFVRGRCWSNGGSPGTSDMISQKLLSGVGTNGARLIDAERAYLFRLRAGNDSRGNAVYFRKWYHTLGAAPGGLSPNANVQQNVSGYTVGERGTMAGVIATIGGIGGGVEPWHIEAKSYRKATAGANWDAHKYLEHRQLGDMWRAQ